MVGALLKELDFNARQCYTNHDFILPIVIKEYFLPFYGKVKIHSIKGMNIAVEQPCLFSKYR